MSSILSAPNIHLENISFSFSDQVIFSGLDFEVKAGQWTCILGPSGCGKSTLLRLISGIFRDGLSGRVSFDGKESPAATTALMAQKDLLLPWLSVIDNVLLGDRLRGSISETRN